MCVRAQESEAFSLGEGAARGQLPAQEIPKAVSGHRVQIAIPALVEMRFFGKCGKCGKAFAVYGHESNSGLFSGDITSNSCNML
jgi:hypothetical protein